MRFSLFFFIISFCYSLPRYLIPSIKKYLSRFIRIPSQGFNDRIFTNVISTHGKDNGFSRCFPQLVKDRLSPDSSDVFLSFYQFSSKSSHNTIPGTVINGLFVRLGRRVSTRSNFLAMSLMSTICKIMANGFFFLQVSFSRNSAFVTVKFSRSVIITVLFRTRLRSTNAKRSNRFNVSTVIIRVS